MFIEAFGKTDVGRRRALNEDFMLMDSELGIYLVADGMGGAASGEVASSQAGTLVRQYLWDARSVLEALAKNWTPENQVAAVHALEGAVQKACFEVYQISVQEASNRGMGTTLVALVIVGNKGIICNVGDSRIYLIRNGQCHRLTEDHTLVAIQLKAGAITREQAATSQYRNVITRAIGIQPSVQVDTLVLDVLPGDKFLLCSDGLHGYFPEAELLRMFEQVPTKDLAEYFVAAANERGGKDNITALVVSVQGEFSAASEEILEAQSRMEALKKMPLFRHLTYKEQTAVLSIATTRSYAEGEEIICEGQQGNDLYIVVKGRVVVEKGGMEISELFPGGHFGEMGLVDNAPRSATIRAAELTRVMLVVRSELMALMKRESILAVKMLWSFVQVLADRLRAANFELSEARQELAIVHAVKPFSEEEE
ncbi:MAG: cyclic nucleotide-binding domain-containing protein [Proteobacteria bacterium]|nr:cyclic nucleotide-binding domain-containing protein [Cystobacterineae bacterium]MCL2259382.1 cyclic nucleotide-binding domain-containing protein [Cystobacterineae bacterium]MCL2314165.1 cyclic nucleotide-binding domain-containing protein [Pseudomonadota bacterium]